MDRNKPLVAVIMGSRSDMETMRHAVELLDELVLSPHGRRCFVARLTPVPHYEALRRRSDMLVLEVCIPFDKELSVVCARDLDGRTAATR